MSGVPLTGAIVPLNGGAFTVFAGNIVSSLANLSLLAGCSTGTPCYVASEQETYVYDASSTFVADGKLIVTGLGAGRWFRKSKRYVVGNFFLWATGPFSTKKIIGFGPGQQALTGAQSITPDIVLDITAAMVSTNTPFDVCPDAQGNLWVTAYRTNLTAQILRFDLSTILGSGSPTPSISLVTTGSGTAAVWAIAFDRSNSLWGLVNSNTSGLTKIQKFAAYEIAVSGTPTPAANYTNTAIGSAQAPLFDSFGNMWTACFAGGTTTPGVAMFTAAQLSVLGSAAIAVPTVFWSGSNFTGPSGACFGPDGALWIVDYAAGGAAASVKKFDPTQATGNAAPSITITSSSLFGTNNIVFDNAGNMWAANADNGKVVRIAASDLTTSGAKTAALVVTQPSLSFLANLSFPLNTQRSGTLPSGLPLAA